MSLGYTLLTNPLRKAIALKGDENSIRRFVHILCWCITFLLLLRFIEHGLIHKMHQSSVKVLPAAIQMMFNVAFFVVELFLYTWFLYGSMSNEDRSSKRITIWVFLATAINIVTQGFIIHFNYDKIKTNPYYYYDMNTFWILNHGLWLIMYLFLVVTRRAVIYRDIKEWRMFSIDFNNCHVLTYSIRSQRSIGSTLNLHIHPLDFVPRTIGCCFLQEFECLLLFVDF